jgi:hypothetical protein
MLTHGTARVLDLYQDTHVRYCHRKRIACMQWMWISTSAHTYTSISHARTYPVRVCMDSLLWTNDKNDGAGASVRNYELRYG